MAELDPALLARVQFAFTVSFHIIFPTMSIGLAWFLVMVEGLWLKTGDLLYQQIYRFWLNIFAMSFAVGVVTGIVLSFEFGLAFAKFAQLAGPVIGPLIGLEVLTSFFLEAGFLGIMLFGSGRVGPRLHFFATCMVALGTLLSASWILAANSWMQTPDGVAWHDAHFVVTDWWRVVVNPSWPVRLPHMLLAACLTGAFLVSGVSAWYLLRSRDTEFARRTLSLGMEVPACSSPRSCSWAICSMARCSNTSPPRCRPPRDSGSVNRCPPRPTSGSSCRIRHSSGIWCSSGRRISAQSG